jgi:hypothetical protein
MNPFIFIVFFIMLLLCIAIIFVNAKSRVIRKKREFSTKISMPKARFHSNFVNNGIALVQSGYGDIKKQRDFEKYKFVIWKYMYNLLKSNKYDYVVLIDASVDWNSDSNKPLQRLIQQSGDSDLIAFRDAIHPDKIGTKMFILKNTEWSLYKCNQLFLNPKMQKVLLDQVYTPFKHSTLLKFKPYLDLGLPYNLQCTCVYNEKAMNLNSTAADIYPWAGVPNFLEIPTHVPPVAKSVKEQKIPRIIYQTMSTTLMNNEQYMFGAKAWQDLNPEYTYQFFDDLSCRKFLEIHFDADVVATYNTLLPGAYKSDLFRYCLLYVTGGCYVDCQTQPFIPLHHVIDADTEFCSALDGGDPRGMYCIFQGFLCTVPQHPVLMLSINKIVKNVQQRKVFEGQFELTGPDLFGKCLNKYFGRPKRQSLKGSLPRGNKLLCHYGSCVPYIKHGDTNFLLTRYFFNSKQLSKTSPTIYSIAGKEHYSVALKNNRVLKFPLL